MTVVLDQSERLSLADMLDLSLVPLSQALIRAERSSGFWASRFACYGIDVSAQDVFQSFQRLPLLDKDTLLADQRENGPFGSLLAVPLNDVRRVHRTTGTTGIPLLVVATTSDIENAVRVGSRAFSCAGVEPGQVVVHCLNYCMWSGGVTDHQCLEAAGAAVIPFGVGNSRELVQTILNVRPTALSCTPSYLLRLKQLLVEEFGIEPASLGLKMALCGGEGGLQDVDVRRSIEETWDITAVDANYGLSEVLSIIASECPARDGLHFHAQLVLFPELVDADGAACDIVKGATGELVLSNLSREAQPLFRYRTKDVIRIIDTAICACGRQGFRFKVIGRADDMITVKGVNFDPGVLQGIVAGYIQLSGEYRLYVPRPPIQQLTLELEQARDPMAADYSDIGREISSYLSSAHSVRIDIRFVRYGSIPRTEGKTRRIIWE